MSNILEIKNLGFSYDSSKQVLNDVNITFKRGEIYAIVGKSGSGKTTLISLISGLDKKQSGEIYIDGKEISEYNLDDYRSKKIGIIFQRYNLLNNYTVLDNILIAMKIAGKTPNEQVAEELLRKVGLDSQIKNSYPLNLSGGQQQRVAIARTLAKDTEIIIADEPTGNLDEETELEILNLLKQLVIEDEKTLIMITHSNVIASNAEHVYNISDGTVNVIK